MMSTAYLQTQRLAEQLSLPEQARLLEYLSCRLAQIVSVRPFEPVSLNSPSTNGWQEFFRVGEELMRTDHSDAETLTGALLAMRR